MRLLATAIVLTLAAAGASAAGTVNVTFAEPDKFVDAANRKNEVPANLGTIERHLQQLGQRHLPNGQTLHITVVDIDLAGYVRPTRQGDIRFVKGAADWPRITLRYDLQANGQSVKKGDETVAEMNYSRQLQTYGNNDPLRHEKQMLEAWFRERFATQP
jgi:type II secretory pathway component PulJ